MTLKNASAYLYGLSIGIITGGIYDPYTIPVAGGIVILSTAAYVFDRRSGEDESDSQ